jgi:hypothetical protein
VRSLHPLQADRKPPETSRIPPPAAKSFPSNFNTLTSNHPREFRATFPPPLLFTRTLAGMNQNEQHARLLPPYDPPLPAAIGGQLPAIPQLWERARLFFSRVIDHIGSTASLSKRWRLTRAEKKEVLGWLEPVEKLARSCLLVRLRLPDDDARRPPADARDANDRDAQAPHRSRRRRLPCAALAVPRARGGPRRRLEPLKDLNAFWRCHWLHGGDDYLAAAAHVRRGAAVLCAPDSSQTATIYS